MFSPQLDPLSRHFPEVETAAKDPNGLLASGGDLSAELLMEAYYSGIFPWYDQHSPILWWSPDPREVVSPGDQHCSKSMRKMLLKWDDFEITTDKAFKRVITHCARQNDSNHWVTDEMIEAYTELHTLGHAHSLEVWRKDELVGGLYGVAVGAIFCGESMFHSVTNASKLAFLALADTLFSQGYQLIDCQFETDHLRSLGSGAISRKSYIEALTKARIMHLAWPDTFSTNLG
jgi:leucyl/phenylalanyl-tRNA---protein transferase